jgi:ribose-phosphate pyrophosphokinase
VYACATHGLFPPDALAKIGESELTEVLVTDSVPQEPIGRPDIVKVITVSQLLANTIQNVFSGESVSEIFAGENQLF